MGWFHHTKKCPDCGCEYGYRPEHEATTVCPDCYGAKAKGPRPSFVTTTSHSPYVVYDVTVLGHVIQRICMN